MASPLQDEMCPDLAAQEAAAEFWIGNAHSVLAVETSGLLFNARCEHHTSTVTQT